MTARPFYSRDGDASPTLGSLQALLGEAAVNKLSEHFGGRRIYVPATLGAAHPLAVAAGLEAAQQLAANFAGHTLSLPITPARRDRIKALDAQGATRAKIAQAVGLTERRVYQVLEEEKASRPKAPAAQGSLF